MGLVGSTYVVLAIHVGPRFRGLVELDVDDGDGYRESRIVRFADVRRFSAGTSRSSCGG